MIRNLNHEEREVAACLVALLLMFAVVAGLVTFSIYRDSKFDNPTKEQRQ